MLNYVNEILDKLYPGQVLRIDGQRKVDERTNDIKIFQDAKSNKRILLFSLTCNPEGITLTRATILIHLDHWWNKNGKVEQINDRIHRISQESPTTIYYLFIDKTIENKIFKLQDHKYQLINYDFDNIIDKPRLISE
jgi:SNF2 family DNA or RNA helicase